MAKKNESSQENLIKKLVAIGLIIIVLIILALSITSCDKDKGKGNKDNEPGVVDKDETDKSDVELREEEPTEDVIEVIDNSYSKALASVVKLEKELTKNQAEAAKKLVEKVTDKNQREQLMDRIQNAEHAIDAIALVEELEKQVASLGEKDDVAVAKEFRDDKVTPAVEAIDEKYLSHVKDNLEERLAEVNKILNDTEGPEISEVEAVTNKDVEVTITDTNDFTVTVKLNGEVIDWSDKFTLEGEYEIVATDSAFNTSDRTFIIDKTFPSITGVEEGKWYNTAVTPTLTEKNLLSYKLDGVDYDGSPITSEGAHTLIATDKTGQETKVSFEIDTTFPSITGVEMNKHYADEVTPELVELNLLSYTLDGEKYMGEAITEEGTHTLVAIDKAGNETKVTFVIDHTYPAVTGVEDQKHYNVDVTPVITEKNLASYTLNGEAYDGNTISAEGEYELIATDEAGHKTTVNFVIDKTAPTFEGIENGGFYKTATPVAKDKYLDKVTFNGVPFKNGTEVKLNFKNPHTITATDLAGNSTTYTFTTDTIAPKIWLLDRLDLITGNYLPIKPQISDFNLATVVVKKDGKEIEFNEDTILKGSGEYEIIATDKSGNTSTATFTMDSNPPIIIEPLNGMTYSKDVTVKLLEEHPDEKNIVLLKLNRNIDILGNQLPIYERVEYTYGDTITEEGSYILVVADDVYNLAFAKFNIDKSVPILNVEDDGVYKSIKITVIESNPLGENNGVSLLKWGSKEVDLPVVGKVDVPGYYPVEGYKYGDTITEEGKYQVVAKDAALHVVTKSFIIDTTASVIENVENNVHYNSITPVVTEDNYSHATLNGAKYQLGTPITAEGAYTLVVYDKANNSTTVNFVIDYNVITFTNVKDGDSTQSSITPEFNSSYETTLKLNDADYTKGTPIAEEGQYTLVATDKYNNTAKVTFAIDRTAPVMQVTDKDLDETSEVIEIEQGVTSKTDSTLNVVRQALDEKYDGIINVVPTVTHSVKGDMGTLSEVPLSLDYLGVYTLTYKTTDKAGNESNTMTIALEIYRAGYEIKFAEVTNYTYNGTVQAPTAAIYDENGTLISNDVTYTYLDSEGAEVSSPINAGTYKVVATVQDTTAYPRVSSVTSSEYTIAKKEVTINYKHHNNLGFAYQYDGENTPYTATLSDGTALTVTYLKENGDKAYILGVGTYTISTNVNDYLGNYIITNEADLNKTFTISQAELYVTYPTTLTIGTSQLAVNKLVTVKNGNGVDLTGRVVITSGKEDRWAFLTGGYNYLYGTVSKGTYKLAVTELGDNMTLAAGQQSEVIIKVA